MSEYNIVDYVIDESCADIRIDKALQNCELIDSRSQAIKLIKLKLVEFKGQPIKASHTTKLGDKYTLKIPKQTEMSLTPYELNLECVYQDDDLLVINKPAGIVMHPSAGHKSDTVVNALIHMKIELSMGFNELRPGIVHRLDKDTSGLVVIAKNTKAHNHLAEQFKERTVIRKYWAIVYGLLKESESFIESYFIRHPTNRKKYISEKIEKDVEPQGKYAKTNYKVLKEFKNELSLVECKLDTGRTHQIRIHMSESSHAIIGDPIYSSSSFLKRIESGRFRAEISKMERIGLHAHTLGFKQPTTGKDLLFHADWPEDIKEIVKFAKFESENI